MLSQSHGLVLNVKTATRIEHLHELTPVCQCKPSLPMDVELGEWYLGKVGDQANDSLRNAVDIKIHFQTNVCWRYELGKCQGRTRDLDRAYPTMRSDCPKMQLAVIPAIRFEFGSLGTSGTVRLKPALCCEAHQVSAVRYSFVIRIYQGHGHVHEFLQSTSVYSLHNEACQP